MPNVSNFVKKSSSIAKGVMEYINEQYDPAMSWKDAEYCIKRWGGPFALKGVMSVEDAKRAIDSALVNNKLDALVGLSRNTAWKINYEPGDAFENSWGNGALSAISGYPHITIPLDFSDNLPTGVSFMGAAWDEVKLLNLAYSFEQYNNFLPRPIQDKN